MIRRLLLFSILLVGWTAARRETVDPVELQLAALEDSSSYLVYRYTATNPATSTQGVAALRLDVSASQGTPGASLPATGPFLNGPAFTSPIPVVPHAPVGPVSPSGWQAALDRATASLTWWGVNGRMFDYDSIAPGDSLPGLAIRSTFFPAIREVGAVPTWQSCCQEPWGTDEENPMRTHRDPEYFMVTSYALAPGYTADEVNVILVQSQVSAICNQPLWLNNGSLCSEFQGLATDAVFAIIIHNDPDSAAAALSTLRDRVDQEQAQMEPEAYWLLHHNVRQAYRNIAPPLTVACSPSAVTRADTVSCVPTPPPGASFEVTGWSFVGGPANEFNVTTPGAPPATWDGIAVVGGTVSVYGDVDGKADTASTTIQVTARTWSPLPAVPIEEQDQHFYNPEDMPTVPLSQEDLAHLHHQWKTGATSVEDLLARRVTVEGGPNDSLAYFSEPFVQSYSPIFEVNRDALTDTQNPFYQNHPNGGPPGGTCRRSDLSTTVLDFFVDRMNDEGDAATNHWPQLSFQVTQEALVSSSVQALLSAWGAEATADMTILDGVRQQLGPAVPPCTLLY